MLGRWQISSFEDVDQQWAMNKSRFPYIAEYFCIPSLAGPEGYWNGIDLCSSITLKT